MSTPSLAGLYRFAMNFLLVRKRNGRGESQSEETAHMDDNGDGVKCKTQA